MPSTVNRRAAGVALLVVLIVAPALLVLAAAPSSTSQPTVVAYVAPPLPEPAGDTVDLSDALDRLPLVVDDLPDSASKAALKQWQSAHVLAPQEALDAFNAAWAAAAGTSPDPDVEALRTALVAATDPLAEDIAPLADAGLRPLLHDKDNAGRLVNAAVALFGFGAADTVGRVVPAPGATEDSGPVSGGFYEIGLQSGAIALLKATIDAFGDSIGDSALRAATVDGAYFINVTDPGAGVQTAIDAMSPFVDGHPDDVTARSFLAELQARRTGDSDPAHDAITTLEPLATAPDLPAGLVDALRGDAYLHAASVRRADADATAKALARDAIGAYDAALAVAADPGLYAGRARALSVLGDTKGADAAMAKALDLSSDSVDLLLGRAATAESVGDAKTMQATARDALDRTLGPWNPRLVDTRFVQAPSVTYASLYTSGDLGYLGASIGSERDHLGLVRQPQGGAYLATLQIVVPVLDPVVDDWRRTGFAADVAASTAIEAAIGLGDANGAGDDADRWTAAAVGATRLGGDQTNDVERTGRIDGGVDAARVASGGTPKDDSTDAFGEPAALVRAETTLRRLGRYDDAGKLCAAQHDERCEGDALLLAGHARQALPHYQAALADRPDDVELLLRVGSTAHQLGDLDGALAALDQASVVPQQETQPPELGLALLGDVDLEAGRIEAAHQAYDLAITLMEPNLLHPDPQNESGNAARRAIATHVYTNRALTALRLAQPSPGAPPRCDSSDASPCAAARTDLQAALAIDPRNSVPLLDLGWAERASGHRTEARAALQRVTDIDPTSFPAFNDLGVLAAEDGDSGAARDAFNAALAAQPTYALAAWNLGVLDLRDGPQHLVTAQGHLARAIDLEPDLSGQAPDLKTDERVYRSTFGSLQRVDAGWPSSSAFSAGAAVLGAAGLLAALVRLFGRLFDELPGPTEWWEAAVAKVSKRIKPDGAIARTRRAMTARTGSWQPWVVTSIVLLVVIAITTWRDDGATALSISVAVVLASASALALHEAAHLLAARNRKVKLVPRQWTTGAVLALVLTPFHMATGPFFGARFEAAEDERVAHLHVVAPVANMLAAGGFWLLYLWRPSPLALIACSVQLAVAAYSLLPRPSLDGHPISRERPVLHTLLTMAVGIAGTVLLVSA